VTAGQGGMAAAINRVLIFETMPATASSRIVDSARGPFHALDKLLAKRGTHAPAANPA
jgi:hypothetical protein